MLFQISDIRYNIFNNFGYKKTGLTPKWKACWLFYRR